MSWKDIIKSFEWYSEKGFEKVKEFKNEEEAQRMADKLNRELPKGKNKWKVVTLFRNPMLRRKYD